MKRISLVFVLLVTSSLTIAQIKVPVFGSINYLKGYSKEISGENIAYISALPEFATTALLTRCTDGKHVIEWETEAVPNHYSGKYVYFAWVAAHSKNTSHGDRKFDLYVNDRKALVFETYKDKPFPHWTFAGPGGEEVVFEWKTDDAVRDAHGYMYLKIPASSVEKGKPVRIKVAGHAEDSRDWYMTFKYAFTETITVNPVSLLTLDNQQPVQVLATHFGKETPLTMVINGNRKFRFLLSPGLNTYEITYPAVDTITQIHIRALIPGKPDKDFNLELKPVTEREIHFIHHSHCDVGYSHHQDEVIRIQNKNISDALRYIDQTKDLPDEARFRYNIEITLAIENFLKVATPEQKKKLIDAIRMGNIGIGGLYANITTGICQPEELFNLTMHARQLEDSWGIRIPAIMIGDIPGITWGTIPALARSGISYFSNGPNYMGSPPYEGDRIGHSSVNWKDRPFWWVSPSGKEKILFWMAGKGYSSWHGFKPGDIASSRGKKRISAYMDELDKAGYPFKMVQWRYNIVADNGPVDSLISAFVLDWNKRYKSPKIILSTIERMFTEFESRYGDQLPVFSGDFTPYWEDGAYSTALEMTMNRRNSEKLTSLGTLYSIQSPGTYPHALFDQAWKNILLWDEHTWGAYNSISDPDLTFVTSQWEYKQKYALRTDSLIKEIERSLSNPGLSGPPVQVDVFNTLSWERKDVVYLDKEVPASLGKIVDDRGETLPFQRLSDGRVAVQVAVQPLSATRLTLIPTDHHPDAPEANQTVGILENLSCRLSVNEKTGSIGSLYYKPLQAELIDQGEFSGANEFLYVPGRDPSEAVSNGNVSLALKESGPVLQTIEVQSDAPGCNSLTREITMFRDQERIEIRNTIDKKAVREKESVHFAFPFLVPSAQKRFNTGWGGIFQPGVNQLAGANQDYYSVQHWSDISNQRYGVSLLLREACLVEPGEMIDEQPGKFGVKTWKTLPDTTPTLFSYTMNNYWHTNFKADQDGIVTFSYALVPHGLFNLAKVQRQGLEFNQPLLVVPASVKRKADPLFTLSNPNVIVTRIEPAGGGFRIRLFNAGGAPESLRINWIAFQPSRINIGRQYGEVVEMNTIGEIDLVAFEILEIVVE